MPFSRDALERYLDGLPPETEHLSLDDLLADHPIACIDGRKRDRVAGVPGGDAGLFAVMIAALDDRRPDRLYPELVGRLFAGYLDRFGTFYLHTDTHAMERLEEKLRARDLIPSDATASSFVENPPASARDALTDLLTSSAHVGCGHLRLMMEHSGTYGVRPVLLREMIRAFFQHHWEGDARCIFDVLEGDHAEEAVLCIHPSDTEEEDVSPHVPCHEEQQVFVYHPHVEAYMYAQHARFLTDEGLLEESDRLDFVHEQKRLGARQRAETLRHLAPDLDLYDIEPTATGFRLARQN